MEVGSSLVGELRAAVTELGKHMGLQLLSDLVSYGSTLGSSREHEVQLFMANTFRNVLGLETKVFPIVHEHIKTLKGYSPADWSYEGKLSVVAVHRPPANASNPGKALLFNGHVDVVPTGPHDMWTTPPFTADIRDGRLYGRGAGDMKAGVVSFCLAFLALRKLGYVPSAHVYFQTVLEEECTGNGTLAALAALFADTQLCPVRPAAAVIPEPFGQSIVTAELGVMWLLVKVRGRPAHVLNTSAGVNAIEAAYALYDALRRLEARYNEEAHPAYKGFAHPINFNLGIIHGGEWASSVPTECTFEVRMGVFPGEGRLERVKREVEEALAVAAAEKGVWYSYQWRGFQAEGCVMDRDGELLTALGQAHKAVHNTDPTYTPVTCCTDARFFELYNKISATCYGPEARNIHGIDESVSIESMLNVAVVLATFIANWCGITKVAQ